MNLLNILISASLLHGLIYSVLILRKKENKQANIFLICMIGSILLTIFIYLVLDLRVYDQFFWLHLLPFGGSFTIAPSFYLYIKYLGYREKRIKKIELLHFSPIILNYLHSIYHLIYGRGVYHIEFHNFTEAIPLFAIFPGVVYLYLSYQYIKKYEQDILNHYSNLEKRTLSWAKLLLKIFIGIYALNAIFIVVDSEILYNYQLEFSQMTLMPYDGILIFSYTLGLYIATIGTYNQLQVPSPISINPTNPIPQKDYKSLGKQIQYAVEEQKLYLKANLSLRFLETHLSIPSKDISLTLNHHFGKNFYEYINTYRIEAAKEALKNPSNKAFTIEAIAYDCGFNSKATFNRVFKQQTGLTPRAYRTSNTQ